MGKNIVHDSTNEPCTGIEGCAGAENGNVKPDERTHF